MNGAEQRERHTAVQTAERRIDDTVTVLGGLAAEILRDRNLRETQVTDLYRRLQGVCGRQLVFESMSFWQRLKWLLTGEIA